MVKEDKVLKINEPIQVIRFRHVMTAMCRYFDIIYTAIHLTETVCVNSFQYQYRNVVTSYILGRCLLISI